MLIDVIQIYRARNNKPLATKLALRFAHGQLLDRATAPLLLVHILLWGVALLMGLLIASLLYAAFTLHWSLLFPALFPGLIGFACAWTSLRLKASLDYIRDLASHYSDSTIDRIVQTPNDDTVISDTPLAVQAKRC